MKSFVCNRTALQRWQVCFVLYIIQCWLKTAVVILLLNERRETFVRQKKEKNLRYNKYKDRNNFISIEQI